MSAVRAVQAMGQKRCGGCGIAVGNGELCSLCADWERDGMRLKARARLMAAIEASPAGRSEAGVLAFPLPQPAPPKPGLFARLVRRVLRAPEWLAALAVACTGAFLLFLLGMVWEIGMAAVQWLLAVSA